MKDERVYGYYDIFKYKSLRKITFIMMAVIFFK